MSATVLVADDDDALRRIIVEYLRVEGLDVVEAAQGFPALLQVKQLRPRVVVLDPQLPGLGGLGAVKRIRALSPETTIVFITGAADGALHQRAGELGVIAVLGKPFELAELGTIIASHGGGNPVRPGPPPRVLRVLIVDDEPDIRETLTELLAADGYTIRTAVDGAAALAAVVEHHPDLVLLDVDMPRLRGVEALVAIRELSPATQVIMMSGKAALDEATRALAAGAFDYVTKPFDLRYLDQAIRTAVVGVE